MRPAKRRRIALRYSEEVCGAQAPAIGSVARGSALFEDPNVYYQLLDAQRDVRGDGSGH